jgi:S1-C subfamily serine protease
MRRLARVLFVGLCAFLGGFAAGVAPRLTPSLSAQLAVPGARPEARPIDPLLVLSDRFESVARRVSPSVVAVDATKPLPTKGGKQRSSEESGSGILIRLPGVKGYCVVTNNHVVSDATAKNITISLADGRIFKPDRTWTDPESDVAVLHLDRTDRLPTATLGNSDRVSVGQWVIAIGSPFGLNQTVTHGIISARERGQVSLGNTIRIKDFLQTDAAINPGSSGGPLFNLDGEVIGINTAIASHSNSSSGVAFSIPINMVKRVANQLVTKGKVNRGYLGLQLAPSFDPNDALRLGLDRVQGALVETVYPGTPAARAGLKLNDVVLQVNSLPVRNENHFINHISAMAVGSRVRLQVWRDRKEVVLEAVVGNWSEGLEKFRE